MTYRRNFLRKFKVPQFQRAIHHLDFIELIVTQTADRWRRLCRCNGILEVASIASVLKRFQFGAKEIKKKKKKK